MLYNAGMIRTFRHKGIKAFFETGSTRGIQAAHARRLKLLLTTLNIAKEPKDMAIPGFGFHALKGNLVGHYAVSVNGNWRLTYAFENGDAVLVDYQDYH
jgi:toxin HigB-1